MSQLTLKVKKTHKNFHGLKQQDISIGTGVDIYPCAIELLFEVAPTKQRLIEEGSFEVFKGDIIMIDYGFAIELPEGYDANIKSRSSTFKHYGLTQTNAVGLIDNVYRGPIKGMFMCHKPAILKLGTSLVSQMTLEKTIQFKMEYHDSLSETNRGEGGFGSTGK